MCIRDRGNGGVFCWYSYITPLLTEVSGFSAESITALMVLAGFVMVAGNLSLIHILNSISAELKNNFCALASQYGIDNEKVAMVMLYHEVMWDLVDNLIQDCLLYTS